MRTSDRRKLDKALARRPPPPPDPPDKTRGLVPRLFGMWLLHKLFGGGS